MRKQTVICDLCKREITRETSFEIWLPSENFRSAINPSGTKIIDICYHCFQENVSKKLKDYIEKFRIMRM